MNQDWFPHHRRLYRLTELAWSIANQVDDTEVRDRIRVAFAGIELIDADPDLEDDRLAEIRRHLTVASELSTTNDVRVPVRNALQHIEAIEHRKDVATDGGRSSALVAESSCIDLFDCWSPPVDEFLVRLLAPDEERPCLGCDVAVQAPHEWCDDCWPERVSVEGNRGQEQ